MKVDVVFMVSVSVEFINGVVVIVTSEIVLKLVEESLVSKLSSKDTIKNQTGKKLLTSFVAHETIKALVFLSIRKKIRRIAIYTFSMAPPITMIFITFNSSTNWIRAASSLARSTVCACVMINSNVYTTDIRIIDPTFLSLALITCNVF